MGIVKDQRKEIEKLKRQIEILKRSVLGRKQEAADADARVGAAVRLVSMMVVNAGGRVEIPLELTKEPLNIIAKVDEEKKVWILEQK